jgi:hypothetical protein
VQVEQEQLAARAQARQALTPRLDDADVEGLDDRYVQGQSRVPDPAPLAAAGAAVVIEPRERPDVSELPCVARAVA